MMVLLRRYQEVTVLVAAKANGPQGIFFQAIVDQFFSNAQGPF